MERETRFELATICLLSMRSTAPLEGRKPYLAVVSGRGGNGRVIGCSSGLAQESRQEAGDLCRGWRVERPPGTPKGLSGSLNQFGFAQLAWAAKSGSGTGNGLKMRSTPGPKPSGIVKSKPAETDFEFGTSTSKFTVT